MRVKLRERVVSWVLSLAMILSLLPMSVFAVAGLTVEITDLNPETGHYEITITGDPSLNGSGLGTNAIALVPDVHVNKTYTPSGLIEQGNISEGTQNVGQMEGALANANLPGGSYVVTTTSDTFSNGKIVVSGTLPAGGLNNIKSLFLNGYTLKDGTTVNAEDITSIPYMVILVSAGGTPELAKSGTKALEPASTAKLVADGITITTNGTAATSSTTVTVKNIGKADAVIDSVTFGGGFTTFAQDALTAISQDALQHGTEISISKNTNISLTNWGPFGDDTYASISGVMVIVYHTKDDTINTYTLQVPITIVNPNTDFNEWIPNKNPLVFSGIFDKNSNSVKYSPENLSVNLTIGGYIDADTTNETVNDFRIDDDEGKAWTITGLTKDATYDAETTSVTFTPPADYPEAGTYTATFLVNYIDGNLQTAVTTVSLIVNVSEDTGPLLSPTPTFVNWTATTDATDKTITLRELNAKDAHITGVTFLDNTNAFTTTLGNSTVPAGSTNTTFTISPAATLADGQSFSDRLQITYDDGNGGTSKTVVINCSIDIPAATTYSISGVIKKNGSPWDGASVSFDGGTPVSTNSSGEYTISGISAGAAGTITVSGTYLGDGTTAWASSQITVNGDTAGQNFNFYDLTVTAGDNGSITAPANAGTAKTYAQGESVTITAAPDNEDYEVGIWSQTGAAVSLPAAGTASTAITIPGTGSDAIAITVSFVATGFNPNAGTLTFTYGTAATTQTVGEASRAPSFSYALATGTGTIAEPGTGLPRGLTIAANGLVTGTPSAKPGTYTVPVTVTDASNGATQTADWTFKIEQAQPTMTIGVKDGVTPLAGNTTADVMEVVTFSAPYWDATAAPAGNWITLGTAAANAGSVGTLVYAPLTLSAGGNSVTASIAENAYGAAYAGLYKTVSANAVTVNATGVYQVTVTVNKDGSENADMITGAGIKLVAGSSTYTPSVTGGVATFTGIPGGGVTYDVQNGGANTGIQVTVNSADETASLNYYTVKFAAITEGTYTGGNNDATVLAGGMGDTNKATLATVSAGSNYEHTGWTAAPSAAGSFDQADASATKWTINSNYTGTGPITLTPTFNRTGYGITVKVNVNGSPASAGVSVTLTSGTTPATASTDASGEATFTGLADGKTYTASVTGKEGTGSHTINGADGTITLNYYTVTLKTDGTSNAQIALGTGATLGTATPLTKDFLVGSTVPVKAEAPATGSDHYRFLEWTATGVTAPTDTTGTTSFTMPAGQVEVTAKFKQQYAVTVSTALAGATLTVDGTAHTSGDSVMVDAGGSIAIVVVNPNSTLYDFTGWTSTAGGTFADSSDASTTYTVGTADTTVAATFKTLPTLAVSPAVYDFGPGADAGENTAYTLTYAKNDGALAKFTVTYGSTTVEITTNAAFTTYPTTFGDSGAYVLDPDWVKTNFGSAVDATGGTVTFTAVDTTAAYNKTDTASLKQTPLTLSAVTIAAAGGTAAGNTVSVTGYEANGIDAGDITYTWYNAPYGTDIAAITLDATGTPNIGAAATGTASGVSYTLNDDDMGKVVFAVGHATGSGTGHKQSNGIDVNFSAKVTLQKDGGTDVGGGYTVTLVNDVDASDKVPTTYGSGTYNTAAGALKPGATYSVYVQKVGGTGAADEDSGKDIAIGGREATVNYFTVKFVTPAEIKDVDTGTGTLTTTYAVTAAVGAASVTAGTTTVLSGTTVTFTVADWSDPEYTLSWLNATADSAPALTATREYTAAQADDDAVKAVLTQKGYTVTANFQADHLSALTLTRTDAGHTSEVYSFSGFTGTSATVKVPKGNYTIAATKDGDVSFTGYNITANTSTTNGSTAEVTTATASVAITADAAFAVVTDGPIYTFTVSDGDATGADAETFTGTYGNNTISPANKTVTVTNTGNMPMKFTLTTTDSESAFNGAAASLSSTNAVEPGNTVTFTVTPNTNMNAKDGYTATYTIKAFKADGTTSAGAADQTYTATLNVAKAEINAGAVTVAAPEAGQPLANGVIGTVDPLFTQTTAWSNSGSVGGTAAYGTAYTATVTLSPSSTNYKFVAGTYTINGQVNGSSADNGSVTVTVTDTAVTLTYTFPATKLAVPTNLTVGAEGTSYDAGQFSVGAAETTGVKYYYVVTSSEQAGLTAEAVVTAAGGGTAVADQVSFGTSESSFTNRALSGLTQSDHTYYVHAVAQAVGADGNTSALTSVVSNPFETWYKLTVNLVNAKGDYDDTAYNTVTVGSTTLKGTTTPADRTADVGVKQTQSVALAATAATRGWELKEWSVALTGGAYTPAGDGETVTATFHKIISGTGTISGGNSFKVGDTLTAGVGNSAIGIVIGNGQPADFTAGNTDLTFQWQYKDASGTWQDITGATSHAWMVAAGTDGLYLGKNIQVVVTYTGDPANSSVTISAAGKATKVLVNPASATLAKVERDEASLGLADEKLAGGGLYLTFPASTDDVASNNPVGSYEVVIKRDNGTIDTKTISARGAEYDADNGLYKVLIPADKSKIKPTDAGASVGQYTVEVQTRKASSAASYENPASNAWTATSAADAGKVVLKVSDLTSTMISTGSMVSGDAVFEEASYDGTNKSVTLSYASGITSAQAGALTVSYLGQTDGATTPNAAQTYDVKVATAEGSYYLALSETTVGTFTITAAAINAIAPSVAAPVAGEVANTVAEATVPGGSNYTVTNVTWAPTLESANKFGSGVAYTVTITVEPNAGYVFAADAAGSVNGNSVTNGAATGDRLTVAANGTSATLVYTFPATAAGTPAITVGATAYNAGKITQLTAASGVNVTFYYKVQLASAPAPADGAAVKSGRTGSVTGTASAGTATYTGAEGLSSLTANTEYKLYVVAESASGILSEVNSASFKTPYQVIVTTDADDNGTVSVGGQTAKESEPKTFSVYGSQGDATANTVETIPYQLSMTPNAQTNHAFKEWTVSGTGTGSVSDTGAYTPEGTGTGAITVTAKFQNTYTVAFDANGGTGGSMPSSQTNVKVGDTITLDAPSSTGTRAGYTDPTSWSWKSGDTQPTNTRTNFGGTVVITADMVDGLAAGGTITFYQVWVSDTLAVASVDLNAVYHMAQNDWIGAPTTGVTVTGGSGNYTYSLEASADTALKDPTGFLAISASGVIQLQPSARMGAAGSYGFQVKVHDTTKNEDAFVECTLEVAKATPVVTGFTYTPNAGNGLNFQGEPVVASGTITVTSVVDPYTNEDLDHLNAWTATPPNFVVGVDHADSTESYTFTFAAVDTDNYNTVDETQTLTAKEKDPNIGMVDEGGSNFGTGKEKTVTVTYGQTPGTVTVDIKNIGNATFTGVAVTAVDEAASGYSHTFTDPGTLVAGQIGTNKLVITPPSGKPVPLSTEAATYDETYTATGTTADSATASATYKVKLEVTKAGITNAAITGLTPPTVGGTPVAAADVTGNSTADGIYGNNYSVDSVTWADSTGGTPGQFQAGKAYTVTVVLKPNQNHTFAAPDATGFTVDGLKASTTGATDSNGNVLKYKLNGDGSLTLTYAFKTLPASSVTAVLDPVDYETVTVSSLSAAIAVDARIYYVISSSSTAPSAADIKSAALGTATVSGQLAFGYKDATSDGNTAAWTASDGDKIEVSGLTGGQTYYVHVAAQALADAATNDGLARGSDDAALGKKLTVEVTAGGKVTSAPNVFANETAGVSDGSETVTVTADTTFTAAPADNNKFGFVGWDVTTDGTSTGNTFSYVLANRGDGDTLKATFHKKISGGIEVAYSTGTAPAVGVTMSPSIPQGGHLYVGDTEVTIDGLDSTPGITPGITYLWEYSTTPDNDGSWSTAGTSKTLAITADNAATYANAAFRVTIGYTDPVNGGAASSVATAATGTLTVQVDAPEITTWAPNDNGTGGMKLVIAKSDDDNAHVDKYTVVVTDPDTGTKITEVEINANGSATYEKIFTAADGLLPGKNYKVEVQAKASGSGYSDSEKVNATNSAGKVDLVIGALEDQTGGTALGSFTWGTATFHGYKQTIDEGAITTPAQIGYTGAAGAVTVYYVATGGAAGDAVTGGKLHAGTYDIYVSVAEGSYYNALTKTLAGTWIIEKAAAEMDLSNTTGGAQKDVEYNLKAQAEPSMTYAIKQGETDAAEWTDSGKASGTVTGKYTYTYWLTAVPAGSSLSTGEISDPTKFKPDANGDYTIEVRSAYANTTTSDYKADVDGLPTKTFTLTVSDRIVNGVQLLNPAAPNNATNSVTYGTAEGTYMNGLADAADAKVMERTNLVVRVFYDDLKNEAIKYVDYTVQSNGKLVDGTGTELTSTVTWHSTSGDVTVSTTGTDSDMTFAKATTTDLWVELSGKKSTDEPENQKVAFEMKARELNYTTGSASGTKTYDGSVNVADGKLTPGDTLLAGDNVSLTATGYTLDNANVGDNKPITAAGVAMGTGNENGFYKPGTQTQGTMSVTPAEIDGVKVVTQDPTAGVTIDKTIGTNNTATDKNGNPLPGGTTVTITWQEKDDNAPGGWKTTTDTEFEAGKEYRPVVVVTPDGNHKLGSVDGDMSINGKNNGVDNNTITVAGTGDAGEAGTFTGAPTIIPATAVLKFDDAVSNGSDARGPAVDHTRSVTITAGGTLSDYTINLGAYGETVYDIEVEQTTNTLPAGAVWTLTPTAINELTPAGAKTTYTLGLSAATTTATGTYTLKLTAKGESIDGGALDDVVATYTLTITINPAGSTGGGGGGGGGDDCPYPVHYYVGNTGVTEDVTIETVAKNKYPAHVPTIKPLDGYKFLGWSETDPAKLKDGKTPVLVDPTTVKITKETTFYAVYETASGEHTAIDHSHYVIGYPNGTFGPSDDITRGSVATIIARACLEGFVEGSDYGNPGNYSDVANDWAYSAISFCTINGVFKGYDDGTFRPGQPITRQEFATVIARLAGIQSNQGMPFSDAGDIGSWAVDGVYTTYANGWVNGYTDGTFKPLNNIHRDEAVKIFNGYLNRGVDAVGLSELTEYVHSGVASHNTEDGSTQYMTWPDVPKGHWAYYEIIEAANDHTFYWPDETKQIPPEHWMNVWIDKTWLYHDNASDGGPNV